MINGERAEVKNQVLGELWVARYSLLVAPAIDGKHDHECQSGVKGGRRPGSHGMTPQELRANAS